MVKLTRNQAEMEHARSAEELVKFNPHPLRRDEHGYGLGAAKAIGAAGYFAGAALIAQNFYDLVWQNIWVANTPINPGQTITGSEAPPPPITFPLPFSITHFLGPVGELVIGIGVMVGVRALHGVIYNPRVWQLEKQRKEQEAKQVAYAEQVKRREKQKKDRSATAAINEKIDRYVENAQAALQSGNFAGAIRAMKKVHSFQQSGGIYAYMTYEETYRIHMRNTDVLVALVPKDLSFRGWLESELSGAAAVAYRGELGKDKILDPMQKCVKLRLAEGFSFWWVEDAKKLISELERYGLDDLAEKVAKALYDRHFAAKNFRAALDEISYYKIKIDPTPAARSYYQQLKAAGNNRHAVTIARMYHLGVEDERPPQEFYRCVSEGDKFFAKGAYDAAEKEYARASNIATRLGFKEEAERLADKMNEVFEARDAFYARQRAEERRRAHEEQERKSEEERTEQRRHREEQAERERRWREEPPEERRRVEREARRRWYETFPDIPWPGAPYEEPTYEAPQPRTPEQPSGTTTPSAVLVAAKNLELRGTVTLDDIYEARKRLLFKWHPDRNNNSRESNEKTKSILWAVDILEMWATSKGNVRVFESKMREARLTEEQSANA